MDLQVDTSCVQVTKKLFKCRLPVSLCQSKQYREQLAGTILNAQLQVEILNLYSHTCRHKCEIDLSEQKPFQAIEEHARPDQMVLQVTTSSPLAITCDPI